MGTSSRKTSKKIKELIERARETNPTVEWETLVPDISEGALKARKTRQYFGDQEFVILAGGGFSSAKKVQEVGINQYAAELGIVLKGEKEIDTEKIVEAILDDLETAAEISSSLLLNAFKLAFTQYLLQQTADAEAFLFKFVQTVIRMAIEEAAKEELLNQYKELQFKDISLSIDEFATGYVMDKFSTIIAHYAEGKITVQEFIGSIQEKLK